MYKLGTLEGGPDFWSTVSFEDVVRNDWESRHVSEILELLWQYLAQRKKLETEEKRLKQKKAREDFLSMLEVLFAHLCVCVPVCRGIYRG